MFRTNLWSPFLMLSTLFLVNCSANQATSNQSKTPDEIDKLISWPNCKVTLSSERFHYAIYDQFKNIDGGSTYTLEILPNGKVNLDEQIMQCTPGMGFWGCRDVNAPTLKPDYLKMPKGIMILDSENKPAILVEWNSEKKQALMTFLTTDMQKSIGKDKLEFGLNPCK